jgi:hypothetical protein
MCFYRFEKTGYCSPVSFSCVNILPTVGVKELADSCHHRVNLPVVTSSARSRDPSKKNAPSGGPPPASASRWSASCASRCSMSLRLTGNTVDFLWFSCQKGSFPRNLHKFRYSCILLTLHVALFGKTVPSHVLAFPVQDDELRLAVL